MKKQLVRYWDDLNEYTQNERSRLACLVKIGSSHKKKDRNRLFRPTRFRIFTTLCWVSITFYKPSGAYLPKYNCSVPSSINCITCCWYLLRAAKCWQHQHMKKNVNSAKWNPRKYLKLCSKNKTCLPLPGGPSKTRLHGPSGWLQLHSLVKGFNI